jgi:branched-chain amino acid transport system ATP-binding protein
MPDPLLDVAGLTRDFGAFRAVDTVDLRVAAGSVHSVIGPNGAGKSTLFALITGDLRPATGTVTFAGADLTGRPPHAVTRAGLAKAFQTTNVFPRMTVEESVRAALVARYRATGRLFSRFHMRLRREALELCDSVGLAAYVNEESRTLSHGDQRALEVVLALATAPKLLLLDEPTAGMSPFETRRMVDLVSGLARDRGLTVLFSEHDMDTVFGISDRVTVLHQGRVIAEGPAAEVRANHEVMAVYLGSEA